MSQVIECLGHYIYYCLEEIFIYILFYYINIFVCRLHDFTNGNKIFYVYLPGLNYSDNCIRNVQEVNSGIYKLCKNEKIKIDG